MLGPSVAGLDGVSPGKQACQIFNFCFTLALFFPSFLLYVVFQSFKTASSHKPTKNLQKNLYWTQRQFRKWLVIQFVERVLFERGKKMTKTEELGKAGNEHKYEWLPLNSVMVHGTGLGSLVACE